MVWKSINRFIEAANRTFFGSAPTAEKAIDRLNDEDGGTPRSSSEQMSESDSSQRSSGSSPKYALQVDGKREYWVASSVSTPMRKKETLEAPPSSSSKSIPKSINGPRPARRRSAGKANILSGTRQSKFPTLNPSYSKRHNEWSFSDLDTVLEKFYSTESELIDEGDENAEAMKIAKANGVKIRDFAMTETSRQGHTEAQYEVVLELYNTPPFEIFPATSAFLQYHYQRFLYQHNIFDIPANFTVEDADRLYTLGLISPNEIDFIQLKSMVAHGAYRRMLRSTGQPCPSQNDEVFVPRGCWTVARDYSVPNLQGIKQYIDRQENLRWGRRHGVVDAYRVNIHQRPIVTEEWLAHRVEEFGEFGLGKFGLDDDAAIDLLMEHDQTYVPPEHFAHDLKSPRPMTSTPIATSQQSRPITSSAEGGFRFTSIDIAASSSPSKLRPLPSVLNHFHSTFSKGEGTTLPLVNQRSSHLYSVTNAFVHLESEESLHTKLDSSPCASRSRRRSKAKPHSRPDPISSPSVGRKRFRDEPGKFAHINDIASPMKRQKSNQEEPASLSSAQDCNCSPCVPHEKIPSNVSQASMEEDYNADEDEDKENRRIPLAGAKVTGPLCRS